MEILIPKRRRRKSNNTNSNNRCGGKILFFFRRENFFCCFFSLPVIKAYFFLLLNFSCCSFPSISFVSCREAAQLGGWANKIFFCRCKVEFGAEPKLFSANKYFFLSWVQINSKKNVFWDCKKCFNYYYYLFYFLARGIEHFVNFKSFVFCQFLCILYIHFLCY